MPHARPIPRRLAAAAACALAAGAAGGCLERRVYITSDPPGALVTVNNQQVGRTPTDFDFEWYGTYDVVLELEGHEPLITTGKAEVPAHEIPPLDLGATILPVKFTSETRWHYTLTPVKPDADGLLERAKQLRERLPEPTPAPEPSPAAEPGASH